MLVSSQIYPVLLSGGSGARLWPLSRWSYPKQFVQLVGELSMFQESALRTATKGYAAPVVVTSESFRFVVMEQLQQILVSPKATLVEPDSRNTAPAILAAARWLVEQDPDAVMLVMPADHVIADAAAFRQAVETSVPNALRGQLVTFGITPTHAETGYGYLELASGGDGDQPEVLPLTRFVEKPDAERAARMLDAGNFLWNSGIFLFTARKIIDAAAQHAPDLLQHVEGAVSGSEKDLDFIRLQRESWMKLQDVSIDYAVMERASNIVVMPLGSAWSDLGSWEAVWQQAEKNDTKNVMSDHVTALDCSGCLLRSESPTLELVGIGLENLVVVAMPDAVLVANRSDSQRVKEALQLLKSRGVKQAKSFPRDNRPWGWFEQLSSGERFQVKRIVVKPGGALSLQSHMHRAEHWIVVQGTAKVSIGNEVKLITENQSVYIPLGVVHRLENPGKVPMILIEVQTGSYLEEDDIIRFEDVYARK